MNYLCNLCMQVSQSLKSEDYRKPMRIKDSSVEGLGFDYSLKNRYSAQVLIEVATPP